MGLRATLAVPAMVAVLTTTVTVTVAVAAAVAVVGHRHVFVAPRRARVCSVGDRPARQRRNPDESCIYVVWLPLS